MPEREIETHRTPISGYSDSTITPVYPTRSLVFCEMNNFRKFDYVRRLFPVCKYHEHTSFTYDVLFPAGGRKGT